MYELHFVEKKKARGRALKRNLCLMPPIVIKFVEKKKARGRALKRNHDFRKYENMMRHDRIHKGGGGGSRIYNGSITDYECSSSPLHDFRRCTIIN